MTTKLTLTIDKQVIESAKQYAKSHKISLSKMIEFYLRSLSRKISGPKQAIPPITKKLSGMGKLKTHKSDKELLIEALTKKHL